MARFGFGSPSEDPLYDPYFGTRKTERSQSQLANPYVQTPRQSQTVSRAISPSQPRNAPRDPRATTRVVAASIAPPITPQGFRPQQTGYEPTDPYRYQAPPVTPPPAARRKPGQPAAAVTTPSRQPNYAYGPLPSGVTGQTRVTMAQGSGGQQPQPGPTTPPVTSTGTVAPVTPPLDPRIQTGSPDRGMDSYAYSETPPWGTQTIPSSSRNVQLAPREGMTQEQVLNDTFIRETGRLATPQELEYFGRMPLETAISNIQRSSYAQDWQRRKREGRLPAVGTPGNVAGVVVGHTGTGPGTPGATIGSTPVPGATTAGTNVPAGPTGTTPTGTPTLGGEQVTVGGYTFPSDWGPYGGAGSMEGFGTHGGPSSYGAADPSNPHFGTQYVASRILSHIDPDDPDSFQKAHDAFLAAGLQHEWDGFDRFNFGNGWIDIKHNKEFVKTGGASGVNDWTWLEQGGAGGPASAVGGNALFPGGPGQQNILPGGFPQGQNTLDPLADYQRRVLEWAMAGGTGQIPGQKIPNLGNGNPFGLGGLGYPTSPLNGGGF